MKFLYGIFFLMQGLKEEVVKAIQIGNDCLKQVTCGNFSKEDVKKYNTFLDATATDIAKQRTRLGGDWAIAFACFSRTQREMIRKIIGPDLVFIVLNISNECQKKR